MWDRHEEAASEINRPRPPPFLRMLGKLRILIARELKNWTKSPVLGLTFFVLPIFWLVVFGKAFNSAFFASSGNGDFLQGAPDYFNFVATGMLVVLPIGFAARTGASIFADRFRGYLDRLLITPTPRETIVLGKVLAGVILSTLQGSVMTALALFLGLQLPPLTLVSLALLGATIVMVAYTFSAIFLLISMRIRRWPTQQLVASMVTTPIMFLSNAFYPEDRIPQILTGLVELNPVSHAIAVAREIFFQGGPGLTSSLEWNLAYLTGSVVVVTLALVLASRRYL